MASHDTIGDFLTVIRNSSAARKSECRTRFSKVREGIASILKDEGYIVDYNVTEDAPNQKFITIELKYADGEPVLTGIERHSRPGRRLYASHRELPRVLDGLGVAILTTSKGILKDRDARRQKVGGEVICKVW